MDEMFMSAIAIFGFDWAPRNWASCNGQLLAIAQNQALFSLLGTTFGGNGVSTFALPDLRGRAPVGMGQGLGLSNITLGQPGGSSSVTLISTQLPTHNHSVLVNNSKAALSAPANNEYLAEATDLNSDASKVYSSSAPNVVLSPNTLANAGGNQPHENMQPYIVVNYCIALYGIFPSRN